MKSFFSTRRIVLLFSFLIFSTLLWAGGVLSSPRRVYVITTEHFEIMFPKESAETAKLIADNADSLYEKAKQEAGAEYDFSMPIIISPDSDILDVTYTTSPYNRIVVFDSLESFSITDNSLPLLSCLYREIFKAVSCSIRSKFNQIIHKTIGGDGYQPISLVYLPFSFVDAFADISTGCLNDAYYQQLLIQAKLEDNFPGWFQASTLHDVYPGNEICRAAASGFAAYLMQTYGIEKYHEFWKECGNLNPMLMAGLFYKVYGETISNLWAAFEETVPVPEHLNQLEAFEKLSQKVFKTDSQRLFSHILCTKFGIVWYDEMSHEVDILDSHSVFGLRQLLFIAEDISRLTLSSDGRYILVSFTRQQHRDEFHKVDTRIYDLKERTFLDFEFELRDGALINDEEGRLCVAGVSIETKKPVIKVFALDLEEEESTLIYEKHFPRFCVPHHLNGAGNGKISCLLTENQETSFAFVSLGEAGAEGGAVGEIKKWKIRDAEGNDIKPLSVTFINNKTRGYSFTYIPNESGRLARAGFISLDEAYNIKDVFLQDFDISGGVYYPVFNDKNLYYCSKKSTHDELRILALSDILFVKGSGVVCETGPSEDTTSTSPATTQLFDYDQPAVTLSDIGPLKNYNPLKYIVHMSVFPFLAIRDINLESGAVLWPSLGLTVDSGSDPMKNTKFYLSGSTDFLVYSIEKRWNDIPEEELQTYEENLGGLRKYNLAAYIENSSTPVDITAGALFEVDKNGQYDFKGVAKTDWRIPVGTIIRNLNFSISGVYKSSTEYYDPNKAEVYKPMEGWTPIWDAYELVELSGTVQYSNSHQYGISKYERRGITIGSRFYSLWDMYEMEQLNEFRSNEMQKIKDGTAELTKAQLDSIYDENLLNISQLNLGLFTTIEIPRLTPFDIYKGWVFSAPAVIHAEFLNKTGTALEAGAEVLLVGNEIQNGFPFLYLYFSRAGLKAGYNLSMIYDTTQVQLPDVRHSSYFWNVLSQSYVYDSVYLVLNTDFLVPIGNLSKLQFSINSKLEYFIRTQGFKFSLFFNAVF